MLDKPSSVGQWLEAAAIKRRQLDRDIGNNGNARHSLEKLWQYVTEAVGTLVRLGDEIRGNEVSLCIVTPPCGNCTACRFVAAIDAAKTGVEANRKAAPAEQSQFQVADSDFLAFIRRRCGFTAPLCAECKDLDQSCSSCIRWRRAIEESAALE